MGSHSTRFLKLLAATAVSCALPLATASQAAAEGGAEPGARPAPVVKPKIQPKPKPKTKTQGGVAPGQAKPHLKPKAKPKKKPKPKPKLKPHTKPKPKPKPKPKVNPTPTPAPASGVFPVKGEYTFGGADSRFGAGRVGHTHQGQDVSGAEGTPIVCPVSGSIAYSAFQKDGAGYYFVLHGAADGRDYVFMHLVKDSLRFKEGDTVTAGQRCADLGNTGHSTGPHLHFEIWVGGWYEKGGQPIDPLPQLKAWARLSRRS